MAPQRGLRAKKDSNTLAAVDPAAAADGAPAKPDAPSLAAAKVAPPAAADKENAALALLPAPGAGPAVVKVFQRKKAPAPQAAAGVPPQPPAAPLLPPPPEPASLLPPGAVQPSRRESLTDRVLEALTLRRASGVSTAADSEQGETAAAPGGAADADPVPVPPEAARPRGAAARRAAQAVAAQLNAKAARLASAAHYAAAALKERRLFFEALDSEALVEEDDGAADGGLASPQPAAAEAGLQAASPPDAAALLVPPSPSVLGRVFTAAARRMGASSGEEPAAVEAGGASSFGSDTLARAQQRTRAWVTSLLPSSRPSAAGDTPAGLPVSIAEEGGVTSPDAAQSRSSASTADSDAGDVAEPGMAPPRASLVGTSAMAPPRQSMGLSRRASLGFAPAAHSRASLLGGAVPRRSSIMGGAVDAAPVEPSNRLSLANVRRISLAPAQPQTTAPVAASRRSSVLGGGRMSMLPTALAPITAIDEADASDSDAASDADGAPVSPPATQAELQERAAAHVSSTSVPVSPEALAGLDDDSDDVFEDDDGFDDAASLASSAALAEAVLDACLSPLAALLRACGQSGDEVRSMASGLKPWLGPGSGVTKIGEGTYGEAFKCASAGVVIKVVPIGGDCVFNGAPPKEFDSMRAEANISLLINRLRDGLAPGANDVAAKLKAKSGLAHNATDCFVQTHGVLVTRGPYAPALLHAWRAFAAARGTENECPALLPPSQLYCVFVLSDGGASDVEHFEFADAAEVRALLLHTALALGAAEEALQFEHRDLHWGNILVSRTASGGSRDHMLRGVRLRADTAGLAVTLIDFTLSRMQSPQPGAPVAFCDLEGDPEIFDGPKGVAQFDTYRRMRKAVAKNWEQFCPTTNALWLHYLTDVVLQHKRFAATREEKAALRAFRSRCAKYSCAGDAALDELFTGMWEAIPQ